MCGAAGDVSGTHVGRGARRPGLPRCSGAVLDCRVDDERYRENRVAVAERDGELVGIAMSGPPLDAAATWARQLYVVYMTWTHRGSRMDDGSAGTNPPCDHRG